MHITVGIASATVAGTWPMLLAALLATLATARYAVAEQPQSAPGGQPQLPILGWHGLMEKDITLERLVEMREAGFTHNHGGFHSAQGLQQALDLAHQAGIKLVANVHQVGPDPVTAIRRFKDHPALGGVFFTDEPGTSQFDELGRQVRQVRQEAPDLLCYINLFPDWADLQKQLEAQSYEQYVRLYLQKVPTQIVSFDHYPITKVGFRNSFYQNLDLIRRLSQEAGKPFWAFTISIPHTAHPKPTLAHMRLQQYSNLAYGAQGLQYFTYTTPPLDEFSSGPLDLQFKRTDIYDLVRQLNQELQARAWVFVGSSVVSIGHTGSTLPDGTTRYQPADPIRSVELSGNGAVVSVLKCGSSPSRCLVIVNRDYEKAQQLKVTWDPAGKLNLIGRDGKRTRLEGESLEQTLEAGDACILEWTTPAP